ncbi:MAG: HEAT repeat domain-containing protein [Candidatus Thermoplasmatota archaeon]|nr:HEAT repeat domain-containing protein [Candidatus Thermoplasmatota archaeon]MBS3789824.1 HEAT repeat domain-containing protein [Candidatus Thermoplasmatota archaeon]
MDRIEELKDERDIEKLIELLQESEVQIREEAVKTLGMIGAEKALSPLIERLKEDPASTVRANAALALSNLESEECKTALKEAADDEDWKVRHDAAIAMGDFQEETLEEKLCSLIKDEELEVRRKAINSLGEIGDEDKISEIQGHLEDESLKKHAARAISKIGTKKAVEPLEEIYYDGDQEIREIAVQGIGKIEREEISSVILDALEDDSWRIREEAAKILGDKEDDEYIPNLVERLKDENKYVVEAALRSLGNLDKDEVLEAIKGKMDDEEPNIRIAVADALETTDTEKSAELLLDQLKKEDHPRVLWSISESISGISKEILKELKDEIDSIGPNKDIFVSISMSKAGFSSYAEDLIPALESERWKIRQKAAEAFGNVKMEELNKRNRKKVISKLRDRLKDNDKWVRARSVRTLGNFISKEGEEIDLEEEKKEIFEMEDTEADEDVLEAVRDVKNLLE